MTSIVPTLASAARYPLLTGFRVLARRDPALLFRRYIARAREIGLTNVHLVVSFDCDTDEDAAVVLEVHDRVKAMGINAIYAVPGMTLKSSVSVYRDLAEAGATFLNHGSRPHAMMQDGSYQSVTFYDRMSRSEIRADIEQGHRDVVDALGLEPTGFRTPHFGSFQKTKDLRFLHGVLSSMRYLYSSSTMPLWGFRRGPVFDRWGLVEFPVTGTYSSPGDVLDSWGYFAAPDRVGTPSAYRKEGRRVGEELRSSGRGVMNLYADPAHIFGNDEFFGLLEDLLAFATPSSYDALLDLSK